jgi:type IV pilus assembly protein PilM
MEIGANAIKAIRLEREGDRVRVADFAVVPHKKVLSTPDVDQDEMTRLSLGQFISQHALEGEHLVISVPGHAAFARFAKLPPVEPKKVPDIVKFEAVQQIPFPIDQVEWDYQTFASDDSPEIEVGIFAITRERVQQRLHLYAELDLAPETLTLSPVAVYNAMAYDHGLADRKGAVIYLDLGTYATDVIIAEQGRCWIRTFPLGGTHFTEAIARAFKLSYSKAEQLKQEAASSRYAKQIMQAMRPVFSDLLQDLQRSIGYYQTLHRDADLVTMVGLGSTFRIPGLRKFLGQQLQMQVLRLDEYKKITVSGRKAAAFAQSAVGMATAYGLALQGVGLARIDANLVPVETLRSQMWRDKTKWFAAAAAIVVLGSGMTLYRPISDRGAMSPDQEPAAVANVLQTAGSLKRDFDQISAAGQVGFAAENVRRLADYRSVWPHLINDAAEALSSTGPSPELLSGNVEKILAVQPQERRLVQLERLYGDYRYEPQTRSRRIQVTMDVRLSHDRPIEFLNQTVAAWIRQHAERPGVPYRILGDTISCNPEQLQTVMVTETGEQKAGQGSRPPSSRGGRPATGRRERSSGGFAPPGPPTPSGGGFGLSSGGQGLGKRERPTERRRAPGPGDMGVSAPGGGAPPSSGSRRPPPGPPMGGRSRDLPRSGGGGGHAHLDTMGPLPERPSIYPPDSRYYQVPITFEVELIDESSTPAAATTADLGRKPEEPGS